MQLNGSIARHTAIHAAGKAIGSVLAVVAVSIMLRLLGPGDFGEYGAAMAYTAMFAVIGDLGIYLVTTRELARRTKEEAEEFLQHALGLKLAIALVLMVLASSTVWLIPNYSTTLKVGVCIAAFAYIGVMVNQVLTGIFQRHVAMHKLAASEVIARTVWMGGVILASVFDWGVYAVLGTITLSHLVNMSLLLVFARHYYRIRFAVNWAQWKSILVVAAPLALAAVFKAVYFRADTLILRYITNEEVVGLYTSAYKVLENIVTFAAIFSGIMLPVLVRAFASKRPRAFTKAYRESITMVSVVIVPAVILLVYGAEELLVAFGGAAYAPAAPILQILALAIGVIFYEHMLSSAAIAIGKERVMARLYGWSALFAVVLYIAFIPMYTYWAAAWLTFLSEALVAVLLLIMIGRASKAWPGVRSNLKVLSAGGLMALLLAVFPAASSVDIGIVIPGAWFWGAVFTGCVVYVGALIAMRVLTLDMVRSILKRGA